MLALLKELVIDQQPTFQTYLMLQPQIKRDRKLPKYQYRAGASFTYSLHVQLLKTVGMTYYKNIFSLCQNHLLQCVLIPLTWLSTPTVFPCTLGS